MSWWPYAGEYSAFASNIGVLNHKGETPYLSRHGQVCNAVEIPFCALVNFLPTIEGPRVRPADFGAVAKNGLFLAITAIPVACGPETTFVLRCRVSLNARALNQSMSGCIGVLVWACLGMNIFSQSGLRAICRSQDFSMCESSRCSWHG